MKYWNKYNCNAMNAYFFKYFFNVLNNGSASNKLGVSVSEEVRLNVQRPAQTCASLFSPSLTFDNLILPHLFQGSFQSFQNTRHWIFGGITQGRQNFGGMLTKKN